MGGRHFITWDKSHAHLPAAARLAREHPGWRIALATTSLPTQIAAVRAGLGLSVIPEAQRSAVRSKCGAKSDGSASKRTGSALSRERNGSRARLKPRAIW
jgi:DNA-binding transcriptional LysR family regulator